MAHVTHGPRWSDRRTPVTAAATGRGRPPSRAGSAAGRARHRMVVAIEIGAAMAVMVVGVGSLRLPGPSDGRPSDGASAVTGTGTGTAEPSDPAPLVTVAVAEPTSPVSEVPVSAVPVSVPAPPARVAVIGDSLIFQTADAQAAAIAALGRSATVFGDPGRSLGDPTIQAAVRAAIDDPTIGPVVLATASNDNVTVARRAEVVGEAAALAEYASLLESVVAELGDRCIVLVDVRDRSAALYQPANAPATNEQLRRVADGRPDTVVVPWSDISRAHGDDWFVADQLHISNATVGQAPTEVHEAGILAYADAVADGVRQCAS